MAKTTVSKDNKNSALTGKKNKSVKKGTSSKRSGRGILIKELTGIFLVSFAVFLIIVTKKEAQTGIIGKSINMFTHSAFGAGSMVLPYLILALGLLRLLNIIILNDTNQIAALIGFSWASSYSRRYLILTYMPSWLQARTLKNSFQVLPIWAYWARVEVPLEMQSPSCLLSS